MMMFQDIAWAATSSALGLMVALAFFGGTAVNGKVNLCNQFNSGVSKIVAMGETKDRKLAIVDGNYSGYLVSIDKLNTATETSASLDLINETPFKFEGSKYNPKLTNLKSGFLLYGSEDPYNDRRPWVKEHVAFITGSKIIFVPLIGYGKLYKLSISGKIADVLFSAREDNDEAGVEHTSNVYELTGKMLVKKQFKLVDAKKNIIVFENTLPEHQKYEKLTLDASHPVDGGFVRLGYKTAVGFNNAEKMMIIYPLSTLASSPMTSFKVPFEKFFKCPVSPTPDPAPATTGPTVEAQKSNLMMILGITGGLVLTIIVVITLCFMLGKGKSKGKGSKTHNRSRLDSKATSKTDSLRFARNFSSTVGWSAIQSIRTVDSLGMNANSRVKSTLNSPAKTFAKNKR